MRTALGPTWLAPFHFRRSSSLNASAEAMRSTTSAGPPGSRSSSACPRLVVRREARSRLRLRRRAHRSGTSSRRRRVGEFHGCDIDGPSIAWLTENLSPPLRVFRNEEAPPLPLESNSFDLIWAISVFTHIADLWAAWLLELHRDPPGWRLLFATIHGPDRSEEWAKVPQDGRPGRSADPRARRTASG